MVPTTPSNADLIGEVAAVAATVSATSFIRHPHVDKGLAIAFGHLREVLRENDRRDQPRREEDDDGGDQSDDQAVFDLAHPISGGSQLAQTTDDRDDVEEDGDGQEDERHLVSAVPAYQTKEEAHGGDRDSENQAPPDWCFHVPSR